MSTCCKRASFWGVGVSLESRYSREYSSWNACQWNTGTDRSTCVPVGMPQQPTGAHSGPVWKDSRGDTEPPLLAISQCSKEAHQHLSSEPTAPTARQTPRVKCELPKVPGCENASERGGTAALDQFGNPLTSAQGAKIDWDTLLPAGGARVSCDLYSHRLPAWMILSMGYF